MISMAVITFVLAAIFTRGDKCFHSVKVKALGKLPGIAYSREYTVKNVEIGEMNTPSGNHTKRKTSNTGNKLTSDESEWTIWIYYRLKIPLS